MSDESEPTRMLSPEEFDLLDIQDQAEEVGFLTPREYAKLRGMKPQMVYYYLRTGVITDELCKCGRRVINVVTTDEALSSKARKSGGAMDPRPDELRSGSGQGSVLPGVQETEAMEGISHDV